MNIGIMALKQLVILLGLVAGAYGAVSLGAYGADPSQVSISGLSSGAFMTVQMFVAHSKTFMGAGVVAGGPYYCAQASVLKATGECMETGDINVAYLQQVTRNTVATGTIDPTSNMFDHRIYLFSGRSDTILVQPVMEALDSYLQDFVNPLNIKKQFSLNAGHAFITEDFGNACSANADPFISDCNSNEAYNILNHIYGGGLTKPSSLFPSTLSGDFYEFDQSEFRSLPNSYSLDTSGYVYVPSGCNSRFSDCKVHVVLHGCLQGKEEAGTEVPDHTGYNEVAELNDIILIYPQAIKRAAIGNPNGCWDWVRGLEMTSVGPTATERLSPANIQRTNEWSPVETPNSNTEPASKLGDQVKAIKGMVDRVLA